ncbi:MAG: hypothetical protein NZ869_00765 [Thermoanaerobaculum sp.]|nr:hypothetical protein [Thermoanaerobaculum sp.]MDW7968648.1 hypothetical protein [Thermoanaerobaculum sp.]
MKLQQAVAREKPPWLELLRQDASLAGLIAWRFGRLPQFQLLSQQMVTRAGEAVWQRVSCYLLDQVPVTLHLLRSPLRWQPKSLENLRESATPLGNVIAGEGWVRRHVRFSLPVKPEYLPSPLVRYLAWEGPVAVRRFCVPVGNVPALWVWEALPLRLWLGWADGDGPAYAS